MLHYMLTQNKITFDTGELYVHSIFSGLSVTAVPTNIFLVTESNFHGSIVKSDRVKQFDNKKQLIIND